MFLVHDTLSECALQMFEVSSKYLLRVLIYRVDTILWLTDSQADRRMDGRNGKNNMSPDPSREET